MLVLWYSQSCKIDSQYCDLKLEMNPMEKDSKLLKVKRQLLCLSRNIRKRDRHTHITLISNLKRENILKSFKFIVVLLR